jgi:hypothetical protein
VRHLIIIVFSLFVGTSPVTAAFDLDIDDDGKTDALTDGLLTLRYMFGLSDENLTIGVIGDGANRTSSESIESYLKSAGSALDIDADGSVDALTDGLLVLRYLFGLSGQTLVNGVIAEGSIRSGDSVIGSHLDSLMPGAEPLLIDITYNIHESLPNDWATEFYLIMDNLLTIIPAYKNIYEQINVYAWNDKVEDPYQGIDGGAYVGGPPTGKIMVLEVPELEFVYQDKHRYSVIAHEYFHAYQLSINPPMNLPNGDYDPNGFDIKWLIEGTAASFESLYIQEYYNYNYFRDAQANVSSMVHTNPSLFESYDSWKIDGNYASSAFITLALAKELTNLGHSEEVAFRMIYKDFMHTGVKNSNWHGHFLDVFGFSVDAFYESLKSYSVDINSVSPSESLSIADIFN